MYGCETWTIGEAKRKRLESFEMWFYRRMINIKWMDRITNEEVLGRIGEEEPCGREENTLRHGGLLKDILKG